MRHRTVWEAAALAALLLSANTALAASPAFQTIWDFTNGADGSNPFSGVVADKGGNLFGTDSGASDGSSVVFQLSPPAAKGNPWTLDPLTGFPVADNMFAGVILAGKTSGILYGVTQSGGTSNKGRVYQVSPPSTPGGAWSELDIHDFTGGATDGAGPYGGLLAGKNGALYGTTVLGGTSGAGTVFQLTPPANPGDPWTETIIYDFTGGADGASPLGTLILGKKGVLYGTTELGGASGLGTVFQLAPGKKGAPWTETVLHSFAGGSDGGTPMAGVELGNDGALYGTTSGGTVFQLVPPSSSGGSWTNNTIWQFGSGADLQASVTLKNNKVYGTTAFGGTFGLGSVFRLTPPANPGDPWTETDLRDFAFTDGAVPLSPLLAGPKGLLYGTTDAGGAHGFGTVFSIKP